MTEPLPEREVVRATKSRDPSGRRSHLLSVDAVATGGKLHITWTYSREQYHRTTVEALSQWYLEALQQLASAVRETDSADVPTVIGPQPTHPGHSALVPFGTTKGQFRFFCVHPNTGSVFSYVELARCLSSDVSFYGLQAMALEEKGQPLSNVEDMATSYLEAIQSVQPEGPYLIGGWSMGGLIAFEMARILEQRGQEVALLAVLDEVARHSNSEVEAFLFNLFGSDLPLRSEEFARMKPEDQLDFLMTQPAVQRRFGAIDDPIRHRLAILQNNIRATRKYTPGSYSGGLTLFVSAETAKNWKDDMTLG